MFTENFSQIVNRYARVLHFSQRSGFLFFNRLWKAYTPDSIARKKLHPEVFELYEKFRKNNKGNNGGDIARLLALMLNVKHVLERDNIAGNLAELGVYKGNSAAVLAYYGYRNNRTCYLFDTYSGFDQRDLNGIDASVDSGIFSNTSIEGVLGVIGQPYCDACEIIQGYFPKSVPDNLADQKFAVVSMDCDLYQPTKAAFDWFYPRMDDGAIFLLHDYSSGIWPGATQAIDEFCTETSQHLILLPDKSGSAFIRIHRNKI